MMVFDILVETTSPIFVLRSDSCFSAVCLDLAVFAAMAYFLPVAVFFSAAFLLVLAFGAGDFFAAFGASAFAPAALGEPPLAESPLLEPSTRSRAMVLMRAISLRSPRIFLRLSVWPIFIWNLRRKSWSLRSCS